MTTPASRFSYVLAGLALLLLTGSFAPGAALAQTSAAVDPRTVDELPTLAPVIERVSAAVVNIAVSGSRARSTLEDDPLFRRFFPDTPRDRPRQGAGSGVIVDARQGYVLTNHHVIENADRITVTLQDSRAYEARVVGSDEASDIAVLRIDADDLTEISLAEFDSIRVGDYVLAIGNPFSLSHTVTSGIVSALGRSGLSRPTAVEDFIQTDASINPGNSGGALINLRGELVGVNSAILSRDGRNIGIGFAIPVRTAHDVMTQLLEHGEVRRGLLGVTIQPIDADMAADFGLSQTAGSLVTEVSAGSAAAEAGLRVDDVIVSIDGRPTPDPGALRHAIGLRRPGERVEVDFIRDGRRRTVTAVLGGQQAVATAGRQRGEPQRQAPRELADIVPAFQGVKFAARRETPAGIDGVLVEDVDRDSAAWDSRLRPGDVITQVNRQRVSSVDEITSIAREARQLTLLVQRDGRGLLLQLR